MKATKLSAHLTSNDNYFKVIVTLKACFSPFGSLTEGIDGQELAEVMVTWVNTKDNELQAELATRIVKILWSATTEQVAKVEFGRWDICLTTPTSDRRIRLQRYSGGYHVEVDFGPKGSESVAGQILSRAERSYVRFEAYNDQEHIERRVVIESLLQKAKNYLSFLTNRDKRDFDYDEMQDAAKEISFFERAE